ncbi:MAG: hypothetical protein WBH47_24430 [Streptosporangiaceae bacterium]
MDLTTGIWGRWMPGFMRFLAGTYLFLGLALFGTFRTPLFYLAALAFTAYGVHWFALGWIRMRRSDARPNAGSGSFTCSAHRRRLGCTAVRLSWGTGRR